MAITYKEIKKMSKEELEEYNRKTLNKVIVRLLLFFALKLAIYLTINRGAKKYFQDFNQR